MAHERIIPGLTDTLSVNKPLVALKVWKETPAHIPLYKGTAYPGMCTQIGEVLSSGAVFYTNHEQCFCTGGIVATGVAPPLTAEQKEEMLEAHFAISKSYKDIATALHYEHELEKLPRCTHQNAAVQLGLLKDIEEPDLVLLFCTPAAADMLNRTYCYTTGEFISGFGGNGGCPFLIQYPYVTRKPSFSYSDVAWRKYVGLNGAVVGIDTFGESAPAGDLFKHFGFTVENVTGAINSVA